MNVSPEPMTAESSESAALRARVAELEAALEEAERRDADRAEQEQRFRLFSDNVRDVIWTMDLNLKYTYISPSVIHLRGYTPEEIMDAAVSDTMPSESLNVVLQVFAEETQRELSGNHDPGRSRTIELELYKKDGGSVWAEIIVTFLRDRDGKMTGFMGVTRDISERKAAEAEIRNWAQLFEHAHWGIAICSSASDRFLKVNDAYASMHGYKARELIGRPINVVYAEGHQHDRTALLNTARKTGQITYESKHATADGTVFPVRVDASAIKDEGGRILFWAVHVLDITDQKRGEEALRVASRMEATSTLAGGIAHDFNNLMVGVLTNASLVQMQLGKAHKCTPKLHEIEIAAEQAGSLAQQLLAFARGGKYQPKIINVNKALGDILRLQEHTIPPRVRIEHHLAESLWNIEADPTQLTQVVMNLSLNAVEAIDGNGLVRISTQNIDGATNKERECLQDGLYVRVRVEDTGRGFRPGSIDHIFEPFYSTKAQGRGLGLAAVYGIVKNHSGFIFAEPCAEGGACFSVYFPATLEAVQQEPKRVLVAESKGETVLVIDDEPVVLSVTRDLLERFGYNVLCAEDGRSAIDLAQTHDGDIHVAILDMGMPNMGGSEAFPHLQKARPSMRIIICTGYDISDASQELLDQGAAAFVQKPYRPRQLDETIRQVINS